MNDSTRVKFENEICRGLDKINKLDPESENWQTVTDKLVKMADLINKDDESKNRYDIDRSKLDAEASLEASRSGSESEKLRLETEKIQAQLELENSRLELDNNKLELEKTKLEAEALEKKKEAKRAYVMTCISSGVTLLTFVGTWVANAIAQHRSEVFEESGHAYTSRFGRWLNKEPNHPSSMKKM